MRNHPSFFCTVIFISSLLLYSTSCQKEVTSEPHTSTFQADTFTDEEEAVLRKYFKEEEVNFLKPTQWAGSYKHFLGRALFHENHLSKDKSVSCASCHQQQHGYADTVALSRGASNNLTDRNSISLISFSSFAEHYGSGVVPSLVDNSFFWDARVGQLEDQMMETFLNPKEMGMEVSEIRSRVEELDYAKILHERAFEGQPITTKSVIESISDFVVLFSSSTTLFDINMRQAASVEDAFSGFSQAQNLGKQLFLDNCASCHVFSLREDFRRKYDNVETTASNGLDLVYEDQGLAMHTYLPEDEGIFKIPGLRNIGVTAPYMHDGRFATLEEVVEFYSTGIQAHPNLNPVLKEEDGEPIKMNFTEEEKKGLVAFLETLTGNKPPHVDNPFK